MIHFTVLYNLEHTLLKILALVLLEKSSWLTEVNSLFHMKNLLELKERAKRKIGCFEREINKNIGLEEAWKLQNPWKIDQMNLIR